MKRRKKKNALGQFLFAAGFVSGSLYVLKEIAMNEFFKLAFTDQPTPVSRLLGSSEGTKWIKEDQQWLRKQPLERVVIRSKDGLKLVGHYFPATNAKRTLLMMHGWRGTWYGDFGTMARYLHEMECNLMIVEQRGMGESQGDMMTYGIRESDDCIKWVEYLCKRDSLPIYLHGVSMGAATVETASGKELPSQVKGIIADCGFTSTRDIMAKVATGITPLLLTQLGTVERKFYCRSGVSWSSDSAISRLKKAKVPVLFVHGKEDNFVPLEMGKANFRACASRKRFLIIRGADHVESFQTNPKAYLENMWDFFGWESVKIPIIM